MNCADPFKSAADLFTISLDAGSDHVNVVVFCVFMIDDKVGLFAIAHFFQPVFRDCSQGYLVIGFSFGRNYSMKLRLAYSLILC